jgi:hypothetical protein
MGGIYSSYDDLANCLDDIDDYRERRGYQELNSDDEVTDSPDPESPITPPDEPSRTIWIMSVDEQVLGYTTQLSVAEEYIKAKASSRLMETHTYPRHLDTELRYGTSNPITITVYERISGLLYSYNKPLRQYSIQAVSYVDTA